MAAHGSSIAALQSSLTTGLSNKADQSAFDVLEGVVATKSTPDGVDLKLSNYSTTVAMNGSIAVKFFHFVPAKSSEAKPSLRSPFMSGRLYCLASTESKSCKSSATSASAISVFTRLSDKSVKLVLQTTLPVLPAITRQPGFLWFVVRDSCVKRLFVCTSASSLIMMSSHWCALPSRSRKSRALWLPSSRSSGPLSGAALLLDTCSLLQPAQFFVKKRSSEKSEVLVTVSVLEAKSCGAETVPELVTSPHTTLPVCHHLVGPSVVRKAHCYLQRRGCLRDSEFVGQQTVHLRDGVVAEQGGGDA